MNKCYVCNDDVHEGKETELYMNMVTNGRGVIYSIPQVSPILCINCIVRGTKIYHSDIDRLMGGFIAVSSIPLEPIVSLPVGVISETLNFTSFPLLPKI